MIAFRTTARRVFTRLLTGYLARSLPNVTILSPPGLRASMGGAEGLRIAAPGASVRLGDVSYGEQFASNENYHVLGVNYFSECADLNLWRDSEFFVIEPHEGFDRYADTIRRAVGTKGGCAVIVKGLGSPRKFHKVLWIVRRLSTIAGARVYLSEDLYFADLAARSYAEAVIHNRDRIVSGSKTLLWTLSFAYVAGYRKIVLHGFDFGGAYAYPTGGDGLKANIWANDLPVRNAMLGEVAALADLFRNEGIQLSHFGCEGPLRDILPGDVLPLENAHSKPPS